jgi:site-specific recombinase XerD
LARAAGRFLADEATRRPAPSSQARTVAALKGFFRFLLENEQIERDPAQVLRTPRKREALPDVLDRRELARLLEAVERRLSCIAQLGRVPRSWVASGAHLSIASSGRTRPIGVRSGGASP